jgi:hypothetical protein
MRALQCSMALGYGIASQIVKVLQIGIILQEKQGDK